MKNKVFLFGTITLLFLYLINTIKSMSVSVAEGIDSNTGFTVVYVFLYILFTLFYIVNNQNFKAKDKLTGSLVTFLVYAFIVNNITILFGPGDYGRIASFLTPIPLLTLLFFTRIIKKEPELVDNALGLICFFVIMMGITYFSNRGKVLMFLNNENAAINTSYFLMYSLPLVMCIKKNMIRYIMMFLILVCVMMSFKRTGSAATLLAIAVFVFIDRFISSKIKFTTIFGLIIVIGALAYVIVSVSSLTDGYLLERYTQALNYGDERDDLRVIAVNMILDSDFLPMLFGHGYDMMMYNSPEKLAAHNDYLEVAYDYGFVGLILYLNIYLQLFKFGHKLLKIKSRYAAPFFASFVLLAMCSFFSHIFLYHHFSSLLLLFWAITISHYRYEHYQTDKHNSSNHYNIISNNNK